MSKTKAVPPRAAKRRATKSASRNATGGGGRAVAWSLGGIALAAGAGLVAFLSRGRITELLAGRDEGHVPTDLFGDTRDPDARAIPAFRPDMDAPMTAAERAALAPATGAAPSLVADRGDLRSEPAPAA